MELTKNISQTSSLLSITFEFDQTMMLCLRESCTCWGTSVRWGEVHTWLVERPRRTFSDCRPVPCSLLAAPLPGMSTHISTLTTSIIPGMCHQGISRQHPQNPALHQNTSEQHHYSGFAILPRERKFSSTRVYNPTLCHFWSVVSFGVIQIILCWFCSWLRGFVHLTSKFRCHRWSLG